jgi:acetyl esterase/lipase
MVNSATPKVTQGTRDSGRERERSKLNPSAAYTAAIIHTTITLLSLGRGQLVGCAEPFDDNVIATKFTNIDDATVKNKVLALNALQDGLGKEYQSGLAAVAVGDRAPLWQRAVNPVGFAEPGVEVLRNVAYAAHGTRTQLDIYRPTQRPPGGCPVLLQIHGGAWMFGSKNEQGLPLMNYLASQGWICFAINYRLAPSVPFPTQIEDCKRALQWIRRHGGEYGANPEFDAVSGGSAGGHLAALTAMTGTTDLFSDGSGDTSVQAMVPFYGLYDLVPRGETPNDELVISLLNQRLFHQTPEQNPELWESACPVNYLAQPQPPAMVIHGTLDSLVPVNTARDFVAQLSASSTNPVVYLELPATEHSFDVPNSWRSQTVARGVHRFLEWSRSRYYSQIEGEQPTQTSEPSASHWVQYICRER